MSYFITGTDTHVGKTLISCALLHGLANQGLRVTGFKPVAAGGSLRSNGFNEEHNDDALRLRAAGNVQATYGQINPYCFLQPVAPHLAARFVGVRINLERIVTSFHELEGLADVVIVEGVGGFRVPLNDEQDSADLAKKLKLPVILVVGMRLGCLNHALLSADAIARSGLKLAGWVANCVELQMPMLNENIAALQQRISAPLLGVVPHFEMPPDAADAVKYLDIALLGR
jgi:dethiobiotin synthetase